MESPTTSWSPERSASLPHGCSWCHRCCRCGAGSSASSLRSRAAASRRSITSRRPTRLQRRLLPNRSCRTVRLQYRQQGRAGVSRIHAPGRHWCPNPTPPTPAASASASPPTRSSTSAGTPCSTSSTVRWRTGWCPTSH